MARPRRCIEFERGGWKYVLLDDYQHRRVPGFENRSGRVTRGEDNDVLIEMDNGQLTVRAGYAWNGASGPTVDTIDSMRASLVHDSLYQFVRDALAPNDDDEWSRLRKAADREFRLVLEEDGMGRIRRSLWYRAVRWFGGSAIRSRTGTQINTCEEHAESKLMGDQEPPSGL
ncbi:MAG: DUF1353 domain-containing protein [Myxococcota bacterium]